MSSCQSLFLFHFNLPVEIINEHDFISGWWAESVMNVNLSFFLAKKAQQRSLCQVPLTSPAKTLYSA